MELGKRHGVHIRPHAAALLAVILDAVDSVKLDVLVSVTVVVKIGVKIVATQPALDVVEIVLRVAPEDAPEAVITIVMDVAVVVPVALVDVKMVATILVLMTVIARVKADHKVLPLLMYQDSAGSATESVTLDVDPLLVVPQTHQYLHTALDVVLRVRHHLLRELLTVHLKVPSMVLLRLLITKRSSMCLVLGKCLNKSN